MVEKEIILKVVGDKTQKRLTVPKDSNIKVGDYIKIVRITK